MADTTIIAYKRDAQCGIGPTKEEFTAITKVYGKTTSAIIWYLASCIDAMEPGETNYIRVPLWSHSYPAERVQKVANLTYKEYGEFIVRGYG